MPGVWETVQKDYENFEGMLGSLDAAVMTAVLEYQNNNNIEGPLTEFGVYKGRSAAILARFARKDEELHLVDVAAYLEKEKMAKIKPDFHFHQIDSALFIKKAFKGYKKSVFRFVHSDGSHTFDNVYKDLKVTEKILSPEGVFVIDDYFNPHYPQVPAALNWYLAKQRTSLRVFLLGSNKCYLCRAKNHSRMMRFALTQFRETMESYGFPVQMSKTDANPAFDCFSFRGINQDKLKDEFYGEHLYKGFYNPDKYDR